MSKSVSQNEIDQNLEHLNSLIRQGKQGKAREILLELPLKRLPRQSLASVADIMRRLNMPRLMLKLLKGIVYNENQIDPAATPKERALYATGLSRLGVFQEAQQILRGLDEEADSDVLLFTAQNFMLQWDYQAAVPKLKKYLQHSSLTDYQRIVGKVNLAACFVAEMDWLESDRLLGELRMELANDPSTSNQSYALVYANALGLEAQSLFLRGRLQEAKSLILEADQILLGTRSRYELLVKKWRSIFELFENGKDPGAVSRFKDMAAEARKARDWETVRDFEFYQALAFRDDKLFIKLYHGSPYTNYRKRIKKIYQPNFTIPRMMDWNVHSNEGGEFARIFDLSKGCEVGGGARLISSPLLFSLLGILTKDFYRSFALGALFTSLYPGEYYNPQTSPNRVYLVVKRLRKWFHRQNIPLDIDSEDDKFKLVATGDYILRVSFQNFRPNPNESLLEILSARFDHNDFTADEVGDALELSSRSLKSFLIWACNEGHLKKIRSGKQISYRWRQQSRT